MVLLILRNLFRTLWHLTRHGGLSRLAMTPASRAAARLSHQRRRSSPAGPLVQVPVLSDVAATSDGADACASGFSRHITLLWRRLLTADPPDGGGSPLLTLTATSGSPSSLSLTTFSPTRVAHRPNSLAQDTKDYGPSRS